MLKGFIKHIVFPVLAALIAAAIIFGCKVVYTQLQPQKIDIPPQEIIKHLYKADTFLQRQQIAEQLYVGKYVEWEIIIDEIYPQENGVAAIAGLNVKAVFRNSRVVLPYKKGMTLVVEGRIVKLEDNAIIVIDKCKIVKIK